MALTQAELLVDAGNQGFSLIELLVSLSIFAIISIASLNLFFNTATGSSRESSLLSVKQSGDSIINLFQTSFRGAEQITSTCDQDMDTISVLTSDGEIDVWSQSGQQIFVNGDQLLDDDVVVASGDGSEPLFRIDCQEDEYGLSTFVELEFTLQTGNTPANRPAEYFQQRFGTSVSLRNRTS